MALPLVSCLMPTYNRAWTAPRMVGEAVYWFLRQNYPGPKELLILLDTPADAPLHLDLPPGPDVRVIHVPERFPHLAAKYDRLVREARGDVLMPWEDDDVSLPNRVYETVMRLARTGADYWNPKGAFFQLGQDALSLCSPHSVHHNASGYTRAAWAKVGGYSAGLGMGNKQDLWMDRALRGAVKHADGWVGPEDMTYVYRWGHQANAPHLSGHPDPDRGWAAEALPAGPAHVTPAMVRDYAAEAEEYRFRVGGLTG